MNAPSGESAASSISPRPAPTLTGGVQLVPPLPRPAADPARDRLRAAGHAELLVDRPDVVLDGLLADHELLRDVAVGAPAADEAHPLALALGQRVGTRVAPRSGLAALPAR